MEKKPSGIVFYPSLGTDHLNPVVELAKLIIKDHPFLSVTIITSSLPKNSSFIQSYASQVSALTHASINFIHLEAPLASNGNSFSYNTSLAIREYMASLFEIHKLISPRLRETLLMLLETNNIRAFVMDYYSYIAAQVSSSLNIPSYFLRTQGAFGVAVLSCLPAIDKSIAKSLKDLDPNFLVDFPGAPPIPCKDIPVVFTDKNHRVWKYFVDASAEMAKSNGVILNSFEALERRTVETIMEGKCSPDEPKALLVYCLGPLVAPRHDAGGGNYECLTWLASQPSGSVLFLCFGRFGTFSSRQLKEMAVGLESSGVRFLWVVRNPPHITTEEIELDSLLPRGFLERTKGRGLVMKKWAPQFQVLNHRSIGGFVTHGGWSSVMEAVRAGVPMLVWPLYAEQKLNKVYLVEGIKVALGVRMEEDGWVSAGELEEQVTELMSPDTEKGKAVRERTAFMKVAALEALSDGGSSRIALAKFVQEF